MFILNGILGALFGGALCAFLVALAAAIPFLGWLDYMVLPTFCTAGFAIGLYIGLRTYPQ